MITKAPPPTFNRNVYPNECHLCGWRQGDSRGDDCPNAQCPLKSTPVAEVGAVFRNFAHVA